MKSRLLIAAASAALMAAPSIASADDTEGWYLRGNAGYGVHTDVDLVESLNGDVESEGNIAGSLGVGYDFGNNWRLELDGNSLWTDLGAIGQQPSSFAKLRTNSAMLNAIYDFDGFDRLEPYLGAGLGIIQAQADAAAHDFINAAGTLERNPACVVIPSVSLEGNSCSVNDTDTDFGYQLLAGLGYQISDNLVWDTNYKYQQSFSPFEFDGISTTGAAGTTNPLHLVKFNDVGSHTLLTGFRYLFGQKTVTPPPPPPPPPPAPVADYSCWDGSVVFNAGQCPVKPEPIQTQTCWDGTIIPTTSTCPAQPQTYTCWDGSLVYDQAQCPAQISARGNDVAQLCGNEYRQEIIYYEFNKGQSAETRNTINRILDIGQYCNVDNIRVVGHTDTSGSAAYNLNLSKRRAKDARDELVRQGIAGERITSEGKGETEPFVPTGDGVKEQLNRRTEVLISLGSVGVIN